MRDLNKGKAGKFSIQSCIFSLVALGINTLYMSTTECNVLNVSLFYFIF